MTLFGSKKGYSKKDINFFESFTASARKQTQVLAAVVFIGIILIGISLAFVVYDIFRNNGVKREVDNLNATLQSEEYAGLELKSQSLQQEINDKNQYYYTLTQMRRITDEATVAETTILDLLGESIPSSAYVTDYELTGSILSIGGVTFSYYDAANICYLLNEQDVFVNHVIPNVTMDNTINGADNAAENYIDNYYDFTIVGNLTSQLVVSIGRFATTDSGVIALGGIETQTIEYGSSFEYTEIVNYTANGVNYVLSSVTVDGTALTPEEFAIVQANDKFSGLAYDNVEIQLYYSVAAEEAPVEEGGEA